MASTKDQATSLMALLIAAPSTKSQTRRIALTRRQVISFLRHFDACLTVLKAKDIFLKHLASVDTSNGPVTTEIIQFHMVPDLRKRFNKFVKEYGCK